MKVRNDYGVALCFILFTSVLHGQTNITEDTIPASMLDTVTVQGYLNSNSHFLPNTEGTRIYAGKKTIIIGIDPSENNLSQNIARMAFARIPGLNIWEMDGAGTQINIGSRGTDTHRSIEMNMRQNGYNTNSDIFGYPENHYTPALQAVRQVQLVRGSAALQFGSQFGGMMNYVMKEGDSSKLLSVESEQTIGSNNFFNSYNAVGGTSGKINYYAYYDDRHGDGWRNNAAFNYHAYFANIRVDFSKKGNLSFQFSRMDYRQQIAGGLTDAQFQENPKNSFRARNYFNPEINIPAIIFHYSFSDRTQLEISSHLLFGQRNSVQFINTPNVPDTFNIALGSYNPRQVDRDYYNSFTTEARILHRYQLVGINNIVTGGVRYFSGTTKRKQKGVGTIGSDFDLSLVKPYGIDLRFKTLNYAAFAENMIQLTPAFSITPGFRYEIINSSLTGKINNASFPVQYSGKRNFPLFGVGLQYQVNSFSQLYANGSQAYRPYLYANITPADRIDLVDPDLKDSKGYDFDLGYRGQYKDILQFDINAFNLFYGNRIGQLTLHNPDNSNYLFTTNIGDAVSKGIEAYVSFSLMRFCHQAKNMDVRIFNSLAYYHARYKKGTINKSGENVSLKNNRVEGVPEWTNRSGIEWQYKMFSTMIEYSYVGKNFSDANNTVFNPTGATGVVPAYHVWDWTVNLNFQHRYHLSVALNNVANAKYFTRRINMYPGPGILPADGRTFVCSFGLTL